jgi:hypothetical protein
MNKVGGLPMKPLDQKIYELIQCIITYEKQNNNIAIMSKIKKLLEGTGNYAEV